MMDDNRKAEIEGVFGRRAEGPPPAPPPPAPRRLTPGTRLLALIVAGVALAAWLRGRDTSPRGQLDGATLRVIARHGVDTVRVPASGLGDALTFTPDGRQLVALQTPLGPGADCALRVWDAASGQRLRSWPVDPMVAAEATFVGPTRLRLIGSESGVRDIDLRSGTLQRRFRVRGTQPWPARWTPDGRTLAMVDENGTSIVLLGEDGQLWRRLPVPRPLAALALGRRVLAWFDGAGLHTLQLTADATPRRLAEVDGAAKGLWGNSGGLAIDPDGRRLAIQTAAGLALLDTGGGAPRLVGGAHAGPPAFSPDGTRLAWIERSAGRSNESGSPVDGRLRVVDVASGRELHALGGDLMPGRVAWSPDGRRVATLNHERTLRVWTLADGREACPPQGHQARVRAVGLTADGRAVSGAFDGLRVWGPGGGPCQPALAVASLAVHADGRRALTGHPGSTVQLWDLDARRLLAEVDPQISNVRAVAATPDGGRLAAGGGAGVTVWDGALKELLTLETGSVAHLALSSDGRWLGAAGLDADVQLWDLRSGERVHHDVPSRGQGRLDQPVVHGLTFVPGKDWLAWLRETGEIHIWEASASREIGLLKAPRGHALAVWPGGPMTRLAVVCAQDIRVLDLNGNEVGRVPQADVTALAVSADGARLVTGSLDHTVTVWSR